MSAASEPAARRVGEYVVGRRIGVGGMAVVDAAYQAGVAGGRLVALKRIAAAFVDDPSARRMFLREASIVTRLEHPNVVRTYEVGEIAGEAFIAMELLEGATVSQLQRATGERIPLAMALRVVRDALRGLHAAHELCALGGAPLGLVHQDVSPQNIHVAYEGTTRILDFGVARLAAVDASRTDTIRGKPCYLAPEQLNLGSIDRRADVFAMGIVLHELLTGAHLFPRASADAAYAAILSGTIAPPRATHPDVPEAIDAVVRRALSRAPGDRFATADEMRLALADAQQQSSVGDVDPASLGAWVRRAVPPVWTRAEIERAITDGPGDGGSAEVEAQAATLPPRGSGRKEGDPGREHPTAPSVGGLASKRGTGLEAAPVRRRPARIALGTAVMCAALVALGARKLAQRSAAPVPSAAPEPATAACTSNVECSKRLGAAAICASALCVPLASADCHVLADEATLANDGTIWIGSIYPLTGPFAGLLGLSSERATELARQDFAQATPSLGAGGDAVHPLGLVSCDDVVDVKRAARHLVEDLHVPAIVGFRNGAELVDLASSLFAAHHTLAVAALSPSPFITQIPRPPGEPPLVWRTTASFSEDALAVSALIDRILVPQLRAEGAKRTRVALLRGRSPSELAFSERLFDSLRFDDRAALEAARDLQEIIVDQGPDAGDASRSAALRLREFEPNVVVYTTGTLTPVLEELERGWPASSPVRPRYVVPQILIDAMVALVGKDAALRRRVFGVTLPSTTPTNERFTRHYNDVFAASMSPADAPSSAYDAFYLVAYAALALRSEPPTGTGLAVAIGELGATGAPTIEVGPSGIYQAFAHLRRGESIELVGAGGPLDFDRVTGEHQADLSILCPDVDKHGQATGSLESGLVYLARRKMLAGKMRCP